MTSLEVVYEVENEEMDDAAVRISNVIKTTARGERETIRIVVFSKGDVSIALEVEERNGRTFIKSRDEDLPALFCEFPLVGSNAFEFPVVINSPVFKIHI